MKQTTALKKIAQLRKKIKVIQGGQGAGKTIAILILLINHASSVADREILICSSELTKMRLTVIKDFVIVMKSFGIYSDRSFVSGTLYRFPNGSFIKFIGLDKEDVGKGLRSHVVYFNELNKINFETYRELASRADQIYSDFNPNAKFYVHDEVITRDDCDYITLTFEDNEQLNQTERDEILRYKLLGYDDEGEIISKYWANKWRVYGLGEIGILEGAVYENWEIIDELPPEAKILGGGIDFGWVNPQAAVAAYEYNGRKVYDEVEYGSMRGTDLMAQSIIERGLENENWYCDNAAPELISKLQDLGINADKCESKTGLINYAIDKMSQDTFYVTRRSVNLISELYKYEWETKKDGAATGKPKKTHDHGMNAVQYFEGTEDKYSGEYNVSGL